MRGNKLQSKALDLTNHFRYLYYYPIGSLALSEGLKGYGPFCFVF